MGFGTILGDFQPNGFSAFTTDGQLIESAEWPNHPWAVGIQFHPEFSSTPLRTGHLFRDFIAAAVAGCGREPGG